MESRNSHQELKKMLAPRCHVIRNGNEQVIYAENLIPGDCES